MGTKKFLCEYDGLQYNPMMMSRILKQNSKMFDYYFDKLPENLKNECIKSGNFKYKYLYKIIANNIIYCKITNKVIPYDRVLRGCITFSDEISLFCKGSATRGKKRPDHAILISKKLKGVPKSKEHREKMKKRLSSLDFKIKFLQNKKINFDSNNELDILDKYSNYTSKERKSFNYKKRFCINNYIKYINDDIINNKQIEKLNDDQIIKLYSELMSIKSSLAMANSKTMGNAKISIVENLNYNLRGLINLEVRSSMEKRIILFFEKNKIFWDYEVEIIDYEYIFNRKYIVDFKFIIDGNVNFLEVKGSVRHTDLNKTMKKIESAIKKFGKIYLWQGELLSSINSLSKICFTNFNQVKIKHIYGENAKN